MTRSIDRGYESMKRALPVALAADIRAGLANGSMVRGIVERMATGMGLRPVQGDILISHQVTSVDPPRATSQTAVAWEVIGRPDMDGTGWRAPIVGIRETPPR